MKNINEKESFVESDLEEGEIPDFEISQNPGCGKEEERNVVYGKLEGGCTFFDRGKINLQPHIQDSSQTCILRNSSYMPAEKGRYELFHEEGIYASEESKKNPGIRNQVPPNTFQDHNTMGKKLKYFHPFQTTYGSVEHIMTKIGETLGRSSDIYYKRRRSNDPRGVIKLNDNLGATIRDSSSLFIKLTNRHYKRRRHSESNTDSDREIWDVGNKLKGRNSTDLSKKEEKDFKKKRKAKCNNETKSYNMLEKNVRVPRHSRSPKSNPGGNERLLRAIRVLQERENLTNGISFGEDNSKAVDSLDSTSEDKIGEKSSFASCPSLNADNQENRSYENFSEKSSANDESDDDVELIKLRLLALTSNKKKSQVMIGEKLNNIHGKNEENSKEDLIEHEKKIENSQDRDHIMLSKNNEENGIDRYELMLRAEALKTALLKKHKRSISVAYEFRDKGNTAISGNQESAIFASSEEDAKTKDDGSLSPIQTELYREICDSLVTNKEDISKDVSGSENIVENSGSSGEQCDNIKRSLERENNSNDLLGVNSMEKKLKKKRLKKHKKFVRLNLSEPATEVNSGAGNDNDQKVNDLLTDNTSSKKLMDLEKKIILSNSSQSKKTNSPILEMEQTMKNSGPPICATSTTKIPETEIERIIVHLGSDSSDEDISSQNNVKSGCVPSPKNQNCEQSLEIFKDPQSKITDYEKSVELLLKDARRRIEQNLKTSDQIPPTPEAVYNHLAPSQRLEYIRLKQKIAETEKLRKNKEKSFATCQSTHQLKNFKFRAYSVPEIQNRPVFANKMSVGLYPKTSCGNSVTDNKNSNLAYTDKKNKINSQIIKNAINKGGGRDDVYSLKNNGMDQKILLKNGNSTSVVKNILERKKTLTQNRLHLERLKILWKNIKMEKLIEDKCKNELKRLKIRQNFFELKISQQRMKIKKLADESKQIYEAFKKMNKGLELMAKKRKSVAENIDSKIVEDNVEGSHEIGKSPKTESVEKVDYASEKAKQEERNLKGQINMKDEEECIKKCDSSRVDTTLEQMKEYNSPLQSHTTGQESPKCQRVDPNTIMCQYDLMGRCNDEECPYQHLRA